jgi:hypothetical protein
MESSEARIYKKREDSTHLDGIREHIHTSQHGGTSFDAKLDLLGESTGRSNTTGSIALQRRARDSKARLCGGGQHHGQRRV